MSTPNCPKCGAPLEPVPAARSVATSPARLLVLLAVACVFVALQVFAPAASPYAVIAVVAVGLLVYAIPAWRAHRKAALGDLSCRNCNPGARSRA